MKEFRSIFSNMDKKQFGKMLGACLCAIWGPMLLASCCYQQGITSFKKVVLDEIQKGTFNH